MRTLTEVDALQQTLFELRQASNDQARIALVPTMGNLHAGHLGLVQYAQSIADHVVVSIFVNPSQFGPKEDLEQYPRTLAADQQKLAALKVDVLFTPDVASMYPLGLPMQVRVQVPQLSQQLCGRSRPGHFDGVATVVTRLFNLVRPDIAIFGRKDFQQLKVIEALNQALGFGIEIHGAPIAREANQLAMSSRNQYLSEQQYQQAATLYQTMITLRDDLLRPGVPWTDTRIQSLCDHGQMYLADQGFIPEYMSLHLSKDLTPANADNRNEPLVLLAAARLGSTRLIDNIEFTASRY